MARCGCTQSCACTVVAGAGVVVEGNGSPGTPFEISMDPLALNVLDTSSIDLELAGTGTQEDPWNLSGAVNLDPDDGNLIEDTGNGLTVSCDSVKTCIGYDVLLTRLSDLETAVDVLNIENGQLRARLDACGCD